MVADHIRSCSFLIADGVMPANDGRGYVLRALSGAVRHGYKLGASDVFFYKLVATLSQVMGDAYPELVTQQARLKRRKQKAQFARTLARGMTMLENALRDLSDTLSATLLLNCTIPMVFRGSHRRCATRKIPATGHARI